MTFVLFILGALAMAALGWVFVWIGSVIETMDRERKP
jgi:hypothetical protein